VKRSAFLRRAEIGYDIITIFKNIVEGNIDSPLLAKIKTKLEQLIKEFNKLKLLSIFDTDEYIIIIGRIIPLIEIHLEKISQDEADLKKIAEINNVSINSMNANINAFGKSIKKISENLTKFQEATDYALAIDYHSNKVFSKQASNIFYFICYALDLPHITHFFRKS
jgi:vacuolar-type H+-ATPase subunit I/STV1